jgi:hypothetical protein
VSDITRFAVAFHDGWGIGSSIAKAGILALRCFVRNANGCWSATREVIINTSIGQGAVVPEMTFCTGTLLMVVTLSEMLNQQCGR